MPPVPFTRCIERAFVVGLAQDELVDMRWLSHCLVDELSPVLERLSCCWTPVPVDQFWFCHHQPVEWAKKIVPFWNADRGVAEFPDKLLDSLEWDHMAHP